MTTLWFPRYGNCLVWALWMQWTRGGLVCWRKSRYGWWPHAMWSADGRLWWEYLPINFSGWLPWWRVPCIFLFRGEPRMVERGEL